MPNVRCAYCNKELVRKESRMGTNKHFCDRQHYLLYRKKYSYPHPTYTGTYSKLRALAEMKKKKDLGR